MPQNTCIFSWPMRHRGDSKAKLWDVTGGATCQWDRCKCFLNILISVADKNIYPFNIAQRGVGLFLPAFWYANIRYLIPLSSLI